MATNTVTNRNEYIISCLLCKQKMGPTSFSEEAPKFYKEVKYLTEHTFAEYNKNDENLFVMNLDNGIISPSKLTLTVKEMANQLNISKVTAYNLAKQKDFFPAFRIGNRVLVSASALSLWVDKQTEVS